MEGEAVAAAVSDLTPLLALTLLLNGVQPVLSGVAVGYGWQARCPSWILLRLWCYGNMVRDNGKYVDANNHSIMDHNPNGLDEGGKLVLLLIKTFNSIPFINQLSDTGVLMLFNHVKKNL
uniref:uncharacterized protein LOC105353530 n=1 Tax=Fragaria vesca subsp. vesca TaxID=101020 RepID=UPI0005CA7E71|nr:PREDICTED: uncharacterized protein LOC105353530 [Fragaria vesca subsp. vesca]